MTHNRYLLTWYSKLTEGWQAEPYTHLGLAQEHALSLRDRPWLGSDVKLRDLLTDQNLDPELLPISHAETV